MNLKIRNFYFGYFDFFIWLFFRKLKRITRKAIKLQFWFFVDTSVDKSDGFMLHSVTITYEIYN